MQAPELKELIQEETNQKKKTKRAAIKTIVLDYQLLETTI
jgi:hypothetical protein